MLEDKRCFLCPFINLLIGLVVKYSYGNDAVMGIIFICIFGLVGIGVVLGSYAEFYSYFKSSEKTKANANKLAICCGAIPAALMWLAGFFLSWTSLAILACVLFVVAVLVVAYLSLGLRLAVVFCVIMLVLSIVLFNAAISRKGSEELKDENGRVYAQCSSCGTKHYRDAFDNSNYESIYNSNMCVRCYENYKYVKDAYDHAKLNE